MRGRAGYLVALVTLVAGLSIAAAILLRQLPQIAAGLQQVVVPGDHHLAFPDIGAHTIFHERRAIVSGRFFASDRALAGLRFRLTAFPEGDEIAIAAPRSPTRYVVADREGSAIAAFDLPRAGVYRLSAWYPEPTASEPTAVVAIGAGIERRLTRMIAGSVAAGGSGFLISAVLAALTFSKRRSL